VEGGSRWWWQCEGVRVGMVVVVTTGVKGGGRGWCGDMEEGVGVGSTRGRRERERGRWEGS
jgi:hypothetical protein